MILPEMTQGDRTINFSDRFNKGLDLAGIPPKGKGRQVIVSKMFGVSQQSARKWLEGEAYPDTKRIADIARRLRINLDWFLSGHGYINPNSKVKDFSNENSPDWEKVPMLKWENAARWKEAYGLLQFEKSVSWTWADVKVSPYAYGLVMPDDTMIPRYEQNSIIVIDPYYIPANGHKVIYALRSNDKVICGQLCETRGKKYLKPHNSQYPTVKVGQFDKYCGSIRQARMKF